MSKVKLCKDCGEPHETGSLIFFECPVTGAWKSPGDRCELHSEKFDNVGTVSLAFSGKSLSVELRNNPFTCPYFVSKKEVEEILEGKRKSAVIWMPKEHR